MTVVREGAVIISHLPGKPYFRLYSSSLSTSRQDLYQVASAVGRLGYALLQPKDRVYREYGSRTDTLILHRRQTFDRGPDRDMMSETWDLRKDGDDGIGWVHAAHAFALERAIALVREGSGRW